VELSPLIIYRHLGFKNRQVYVKLNRLE
jgi:hypothetical protein